jgi:hypothetical protein
MAKKNKYNKTYNYVAIGLAIVLIILLVVNIYVQVREYYDENEPKVLEIKQLFIDFFKYHKNNGKVWNKPLDKLNTIDLFNSVKLYKGDESYTINKEKIFLCLKDENQEYYKNNMLIYVLAHELCHVLCDSVGHTQEFYEINNAFLEEIQQPCGNPPKKLYDPDLGIILNYCKHNK